MRQELAAQLDEFLEKGELSCHDSKIAVLTVFKQNAARLLIRYLPSSGRNPICHTAQRHLLLLPFLPSR